MPRRPRRLPGIPYIGYQRYFLTSCTMARRRAFADADFADGCTLQLRRSATRHAFALLAYCFMPDHVHLVVYGTSLHSDLPAFVLHFKQQTGFDYSKRMGHRLWQAGYTIVCFGMTNPRRRSLDTCSRTRCAPG